MRYQLLDLANIFHRARYAARADMDEKVGMALHIVLNSIQKTHREQNVDHTVICLEGKSWRKAHYPPYKRNRVVAQQATTAAEQAEASLFQDTQNSLIDFFENHTNCTVLHHPELEADDLIAGWVQAHPDDEHVIISSDSDYAQLLAENVKQYNGITDELMTVNGVFDGRGRNVIDRKTKEPKKMPDPQWMLFEKCIRGDSTDNIFSAYPGVRTKGSKNKVGLLEAYGDRQSQGFAWNNLMLQTWTDHDGLEHRVRDDYQRNVTLIDLSAQPEDIREKINTTVASATTLDREMIGVHFLRFCGRYDLARLSENSANFAKILSAPLPAK